MNKYETWFGVGAKGGGTVFTAGAEYLGGEIVNLGTLSDRTGFQVLSTRVGLGLGAGMGMCACFVFNCLNLWTLHDTETTDWGVNIAIGGKWSEIAKTLGKGRFIQSVAAGAKAISKGKVAQPDQIESIRNGLAYMYNAYDLGTMSGPKMITIDVPGVGVGLELSAHYLQGTIEILN